jgi:hypothetical protein
LQDWQAAEEGAISTSLSVQMPDFSLASVLQDGGQSHACFIESAVLEARML